MSRGLICYIGLGSVPATLAPHDQPDLGGKRLAQGHRRRLALASIASHNPTMTPDLTDDDKVTLAGLLRETIERDRFPLSPRVRSFTVILAKLDPPAPRSTPIPPPKPPRERIMARPMRIKVIKTPFSGRSAPNTTPRDQRSPIASL